MNQPASTTRDTVDRAMRPFALPIGLASPMWMTYGAAIGLSATWWWMSRMSRLVAPTPVEAANEPVVTVIEPLTSAVAKDAAAPAAIAPPLSAIEEAAAAATDMIETVPIAAATVEPSIEQVDELTLMRGVGPRVADALVARGVTTFAQLAAWTENELAAFDAELKLLGRSKRYDFLGQARDLAGS